MASRLALSATESSVSCLTMLDAMHADLLRTYVGLPGVNADDLIGLALARPRDRWVQ